MSDNGHFKVPTPYNEPVRTYEPAEVQALIAYLKSLESPPPEVAPMK